MAPTRSAKYRSYLLRYWFTPVGAAGPRFVVETVSGPQQHWGFERFEDLMAFLEREFKQTTATSATEPRSDEDTSHG